MVRPTSPSSQEDATPVDLPDAEGVRRSVSPMLRPVWTIAGGELHRAADVEVPLRPFLDADREVDCSVPI